jgi:acetyltransferase-like isoleucine patch superfamily enzyme
MPSYPDVPPAPVHKSRPSRLQRALRLLLSGLDPRAWLHLVRLVNYYNYSHVMPRRRLNFAAPCNISPTVNFSNPERISAGPGLRLGAGCYLWAGNATGHIRLGRNVMFGPEVMVTASGYRFNAGSPVTDQPMDEADVVIGDDVWVGARAILLPGARIGAGAIIAAGAVVRGEIPAMAIAAGVPARIVGQRELPPGVPLA